MAAAQEHSKPGSRPVVIGLAGGVGSGKSTAAGVFASLGAAVLDADEEAKSLFRKPSVRDELRRWWGEQVLNSSGEIDPAKVADLIFTDDLERRRLEALIHPLVIESHQQSIRDAGERSEPAVVIDAPLLFESGLDRVCDAVVFIETPTDQRLERVRRTRGWGEAELLRREQSQEPLERKRQRSHYVVTNAADTPDLKKQIRDVFAECLSRQGRSNVD